MAREQLAKLLCFAICLLLEFLLGGDAVPYSKSDQFRSALDAKDLHHAIFVEFHCPCRDVEKRGDFLCRVALGKQFISMMGCV